MSSHPEGRSGRAGTVRPASRGGTGSPVLAALTVLALVAGGWWWTAADPHADSVAAGTGVPSGVVPGLPRAGPAGLPYPDAAGLSRANAFPVPRPGQAGAAYSSRLDIQPDGGAARERRWPNGGIVAFVDPATGQAITAPSPEDLLALADSGSGPAPLGTVLWRENRVLTDNVREVRRQVAGITNARYRLLLLCHGPGDLTVRVWSGGSGRTEQEVRCDGALAVHGVYSSVGGPIVVRLAHPTAGPAEVNAVFLQLP
ncbi:hypothetical protein [Micromonospora cathayae]|uniref:Uncharacterized protein n=1 Tax=Micromonospora cathayae TaxID=3028804 RepID=A0ABY7ZRL2_9ACTN|nr:hypothetical protein [Micromonospora sp. HUAS 3]WDZ85671.1 hypothetical protein PVK37_04265 [Micromonospora sp. HUAS 3]